MSNIIKALGIGALVLALGCSKPIDSGRIIEKRHEPQRIYTGQLLIFVGGIMAANHTQMIDDEDYVIIFGRNDGEKFRKRTVYVTKEVYNHLEPGDTFDTSKVGYEKSDPDRRL